MTETNRNKEGINYGALCHRLRHIYWIGGGSGAGKSTIARRIASKFSLRLYSTDDSMMDHQRRSDVTDCPYLAQFMEMSMDERWLNRSPTTMLDTFHWFRGEAFQLIIEDLLMLPQRERAVVEGFRLLPERVKPFLLDPEKAVWLTPTPTFRHGAFTSRGSLWDIASMTSDPSRSLSNLLERDNLFTARVREDAKSAGLRVIEVDGNLTEENLEEKVVKQFKLLV